MNSLPVVKIEDTVPLKRRLGFFSGVALTVGSIVGSGIFVSPKGVLLYTGSVGLSLVIWCICGLISLLSALVLTELGTLIPKSGGIFGYLLLVFGKFPAFMFSWSTLIMTPSAQVVLGLTVAEYTSRAIFAECEPSILFKQLIASAVILTAGISNCISVRIGAATQVVFTTIKISGLAVIIVGGFIFIGKGSYGSLSTGFNGSKENPIEWVSAVYSGMWAFEGSTLLNVVLEEVKNPKRNLPLCIITSILTVLLLYILVNVSYLSVLTKPEFLSSWATGVSWAEYVIPKAVNLIPIVVACSVYGTLNASSFAMPRLFFAAAREGLFPEFLSYLNVNNSIPLPAVVTVMSLAFIMMIPADLTKMLNLIGFISWIFNGLIMVAHIILHFRMKHVERTVKVPIIVPVIVIVFTIYMLIAPFLAPVKTEFWYALSFLMAGVLLYIPFVFFKLRLPGTETIETFLQILMNVAPPSVYIPYDRHH